MRSKYGIKPHQMMPVPPIHEIMRQSVTFDEARSLYQKGSYFLSMYYLHLLHDIKLCSHEKDYSEMSTLGFEPKTLDKKGNINQRRERSKETAIDLPAVLPDSMVSLKRTSTKIGCRNISKEYLKYYGIPKYNYQFLG